MLTDCRWISAVKKFQCKKRLLEQDKSMFRPLDWDLSKDKSDQKHPCWMKSVIETGAYPLCECSHNPDFGPGYYGSKWIYDDGKRRKVWQIEMWHDRLVQAVFRAVVSDFLDPYFHNRSFAYRPSLIQGFDIQPGDKDEFLVRRGPKAAVQELQKLLIASPYALKLDLSNAFGSVDQEKLFLMFGSVLKCDSLTGLMMVFIACFEGTGVPQGAPFADVLFNMYMSPLDFLLEDNGFRFVRYSDDVVVACNSPAERKRAENLVDSWLAGNRLKHTVAHKDFRKPDGLNFCGFNTTPTVFRLKPKTYLKLAKKLNAQTDLNKFNKHKRALIAHTDICEKDYFSKFTYQPERRKKPR